ncbi:bifunctional serine/threonine-protein kinase/formylglycine-generating enzyme family protein [Planctomycetota bacterium]|nr:bifunctional serine/threonine-protein kinase/formylglycine-generating enzyme family protein [Planctomycetota bacterium]
MTNSPDFEASPPSIPVDETVAYGDAAQAEAASQRPSHQQRTGRVGKFEIVRALGQGGMGAVYLARDVEVGREVALKVAFEHTLDTSGLARFRREGELTARLDHPGIVRIHSAGDVKGMPYLAYELVEGGQTLDQAWAGEPRGRRVEWVRDVARAVGHAHTQGVVHRDLKPENVLVDPSGHVRVADFGLATAAGVDRLTKSGTFLGTPSFMAPEQYKAEHDQVGPPTDVWALGVLLYEALTGNMAFDGSTLPELGSQILLARPKPPRQVDSSISEGLEAVCERAIRATPSERYRDARAFAADLERALAGQPLGAHARRSAGRPLGTVAALVVAVLAFVAAERYLAGEAARVEAERVAAVTALYHRPQRPPAELLGPVPGDNASPATQAGSVEAPAWWETVAPDRRPATPLPVGLIFGEAEGDYVNVRDGSLLRWVPAGDFMMGGDEGDPDEQAPHQVTFSRGFFVGKLEVSRGQYRAFCFETGRGLPVDDIQDPAPFSAGAEHPIFHVTWDDAQAYCAWAGLRLPSEAEWEFAARGPAGLRYPWGNADAETMGLVANVADRATGDVATWTTEPDYDDGCSFVAPVGNYPLGASPFGCLDMAGNVWEWTADCYRPHYGPTAVVDPLPAPLGEREINDRVIRGGSWCYSLMDCRTANRGHKAQDSRLDSVGFRVAR